MAAIQDILFIAMQGFSGAVAGYITNKYAVNMIFKEYTPLKIGGAVKKNKEKFIEEVSELVEKDIINSQTLMGSIKSEDFSKVIDDLCIELINNSIGEQFKDTKLKSIPGIENTADNGITFIEQNLQEELPNLIDNLSNKIDLKYILQDDQLNNISDSIINLIVDEIESDNKLEELLSYIYDQNKEITLQDILSENATNNLINGISNVLNDSVNKIIDDEQKSLELLEKVYELFDLKSVISKLEDNLEQKSIEDILGTEGLESIGDLLFEHIKNLIRKDEGKESLQNIICELLELAKDMDITLFEILPEDIANSLIAYIKDIIPQLAPHISNWLYENKEKIDDLINQAVEETAQNVEDSSVKGLLEKFGGMLSTISQTLKIVDRASDMVMNYELTPEASNKIYIAIAKFLEDTTIADLIQLLESNLSMTEEDISQNIINLIDTNGDILIGKLIYNFKDKKICELVELDLEKIFKSKGMPLIYKWIKSNKQQINIYLNNSTRDKSIQLLSTNLEGIISNEKINSLSKNLPKFISKYISNNKKICKSYVEKIVLSSIEKIDIENIIIKNKETLILLICSKFNDLKKFICDDLKDKEVEDLLKLIKDKEGFSLSLSKKIHNGLINNSEKVFDNNVKRVIYNNLIKLDEDEICNIAQSFMGKQLKPLSYFGALLGTIVGFVFAFFINGTINPFGFYNEITTTVVSCILMGMVGILTNVIALWMIFHPYEKNKFVAKIPLFKIFAQGYIPAHKSGFANGMAHFIDNELLKGKRVEELFNSKKDSFSESIFNFVSNNNFKILLDIVTEKKDNISKFLYEFIIKRCNKNKSSIAKYLSKNINKVNLSTVVTKEKTLDVSEKFLCTLDKFNDSIVKFAQNKIDKQQTLNQLLPDNIAKSINENINQAINENINTAIEKILKEEAIKSIILNNSATYENITAKTIEEFIGFERVNKLKVSVENNLNNYIISKLPDVLDKGLYKLLEEQLSEDNTIGEIFGGKIKVTIDKNLYKITSDLLYKLCVYIKENKEDVIDLVAKMIRDQLNFFIRMAYDFMNGNHLVGLVVENIIDTKLVDFVNDIMYSTVKTASICTNSIIYPTTMGNLGLNIKEINTKVVTGKIVESIKDNEIIFQNVDNIFISTIDEFKDIHIIDIIKDTNIGNLDGLYVLFEDEVVIIVDNTRNNYQNNQTTINEFVNNYVIENITSQVLNSKLDIVDVDNLISEIVKFSLDKLNNEQCRNILLQLVESIYDNKISNMKADDLISLDILSLGIESAMNRLFKDFDFNENNQYITDKIVLRCVESEFRFIDNSTIEYIMKNMIDSILITSIGFTVDAMKALKLKEITTEQVEIMDPREIHVLFKSFAGDFFIKLYLYGSMGAVFGINIYLSIILGLLDIAYSKKIESIDITTDNIFKE